MRPDTGLTSIGRLPVDVPEVLDLLIVGAGPGGTAAALRGLELDLSLMVVDYDDILKRIRDYSKDKLILPDFGGGDQVRFPAGGDRIADLRFQPIDKDEMHQRWKRLYREHEVPVRIGFELVGVERRGEILVARLFDHQDRVEREQPCRHLVLAIGRGVPRRFDIPGNPEGITFRLDDPARYVGRPVCVVGGGTSAAEAVIAISKAKFDAEDACAVYWSYRGDRLPRVSKALADVFFEAYVGAGNIRYLPQSEPTAVVTGDDRREYLALRVDRRSMEGRPIETTHLEFPKDDCIACIGEDIPESLLASMGVHPVTGGPKHKKRMCVTPLLETQVANIYLVGDILSQVYLETEDFAADPSTFREVKHRGNVKSALRDGVFVAEVIRQRLDGESEIRVVLEDAPDVVPSAAPSAPDAPPPLPPIPATPPSSDEPTSPQPARDAEERPRLVHLGASGMDGDETSLPASGRVRIGRAADCDLRFADDPMLAEHHATLVVAADGCTLRDEASETGTFLRAREGEYVDLAIGDLLRAGRTFLVLASAENGSGLELRQFDARGGEVARHALGEKARIFGRDAPDVVLDAEDRGLSRRHFAAHVQGAATQDATARVKDLASVNGTYLRVREPVHLADEDEFRVGRQRFRFATAAGERGRSIEAEVVQPSTASAPTPSPTPGPACAPAPASTEAEAPSGEPSVTFLGDGRVLAVRPGQTLCEVAEEHGVALTAECHAGICGSDPLRVVSGAEHLSALDDGEAGTLEDLCDLEPGPCRLACMTRIHGPVVVEIVDP